MWRRAACEADRMSVPSIAIFPPAIRAPLRWWASRLVAAVVLPEADSPTRPRTSPWWIARETWSSMSIPEGSRTMRRSETVRTISGETAGGLFHHLAHVLHPLGPGRSDNICNYFFHIVRGHFLRKIRL